MKPYIRYSGDHCRNCIKCVKSCPTEAISLINGEVVINDSKCINCHICIEACPNKQLKINEINLEHVFQKHDYNIALIPTSILSDFKQFTELEDFVHAIKEFHFDEAVFYSDIEGALYQQALKESQTTHRVMLTTFCPTIIRLIKHEYPTLIDHLLPYDYPVEIAAKELRRKYEGQNIGIFSLCECMGKLTLAKQPLGRKNSAIDYALSLSRMFPHLNKRKGLGKEKLSLCAQGIISNVGSLYGRDVPGVMSVEGLDQIRKVLDLIEFGQLKDVHLIALYYCYQGCIGGHYLWGNPFEGRFHIENMLSICNAPKRAIECLDYQKVRHIDEQKQTFKERMAWFKKVNTILATLPQYDCGSCGFANCRTLAMHIARGEVDDTLCRVKKRVDR